MLHRQYKLSALSMCMSVICVGGPPVLRSQTKRVEQFHALPQELQTDVKDTLYNTILLSKGATTPENCKAVAQACAENPATCNEDYWTRALSRVFQLNTRQQYPYAFLSARLNYKVMCIGNPRTDLQPFVPEMAHAYCELGDIDIPEQTVQSMSFKSACTCFGVIPVYKIRLISGPVRSRQPQEYNIRISLVLNMHWDEPHGEHPEHNIAVEFPQTAAFFALIETYKPYFIRWMTLPYYLDGADVPLNEFPNLPRPPDYGVVEGFCISMMQVLGQDASFNWLRAVNQPVPAVFQDLVRQAVEDDSE
jgi:hypothetical protein